MQINISSSYFDLFSQSNLSHAFCIPKRLSDCYKTSVVKKFASNNTPMNYILGYAIVSRATALVPMLFIIYSRCHGMTLKMPAIYW